uniref:C-type lectin domain-containing protein n=1 Tax=Panagrolaimus superbus TaxID=310955 RepID=A0A914Z1B4_9BILA
MFLSQHALIKFTDKNISDFWFGANDLDSPQKWTWMDGTIFDFENWDKGQPADDDGNGCGAVQMHGGKWSAADCFLQKPYVCVFDTLNVTTAAALTTTTTSTTTTTTITTTTTPRPKPKSCPISWTYYNETGFCYIVFENEDWITAENRCKLQFIALKKRCFLQV